MLQSGRLTSTRNPGLLATLLLILPTLLLPGCANREQIAREEIKDPFEPVNRGIYRFNDAADRYVLRPVAKGYRDGLPPQFRNGIRNFFNNLQEPITILSDLLQGKLAQGARDTGRFVLNSTVGLAGLFDPATEIGLSRNDEDMGQTFRVWGLPEGPYLMVPFFGPYTLAHGVGALAEGPVSPFLATEPATGVALYALDSVDDRSRLLDADEEYRNSYDPYLFLRDTYWQNRRYRILDGNVPEDDLYLDEFDDEGEDEGDAAAD
jgi:phospholipid-binding lipoprotein MlaA